MKSQYSFVHAVVGGVCIIVVTGLLAGFVPRYEYHDLARLNAVATVQEPAAGPSIENWGDGVHCWALRRATTTQVRTAEADSVKPAKNVVSFDTQGIRLHLGRSILVALPSKDVQFAPLVSMDGLTTPALIAMLPSRYGEALDMYGRPLRWEGADALLEGYALLGPRVADETDAKTPDLQWFAPPVPKGAPMLAHASRYKELVEGYARRYNMNPALLYAIIHSESSFSPSLVSGKSAMGLMQLLPSTASNEVHRFLYGYKGVVTHEDLSQPEVNIRYGTAYLHILQTRYFQGIRDPLSREYCMLAAYNMGPNRLLRHFGKTQAEAIAAINALSRRDVFTRLTQALPVRETRFYVAKVQHFRQAYALHMNF